MGLYFTCIDMQLLIVQMVNAVYLTWEIDGVIKTDAEEHKITQ